MKITGLTRRVDSLGRIVIPKELRRMLHIKEGICTEPVKGNRCHDMCGRQGWDNSGSREKPQKVYRQGFVQGARRHYG